MVKAIPGDLLALWGQASAIIVALYLCFMVIVGVLLALGLTFGLNWLRQKSELLRELRLQIRQLNQLLYTARQGDPLPDQVAQNQVLSAVMRAPRTLDTLAARAERLDENISRGTGRVDNAVIELHARTQMVKGIVRAFLRPIPKAPPAAYLPPISQEEQEEELVREELVIETPEREHEPPQEQVIVIRHR